MSEKGIEQSKQESLPHGEQRQKTRHTPYLGVREKLIVIFLLVKILPLILLAVIAWYALKNLGTTTQEVAVVDSRIALTALAVENIERITTDTAQKVAEFLYARDNDINILAQVCKHIVSRTTEDSDFRSVEFFADFGNNKTGKIRKHSDWIVSKDGMHWEQVDPYIPPTEAGKRSVNPENLQTIDGASFNYRAPFGYGDEPDRCASVPLYDEIALLDLNGMQIAKYIPPGTTKKRFTFPQELVDVSKPENTFVKAERYFEVMQKDLEEWKAQGKDIRDYIYVSDVIGAYVPSRFIGMYTPDFIASRRIDAKINELNAAENPDTEMIWKLRVLNAELKDDEVIFNSRQIGNRAIRAEIDRRIGKNQIWEIKDKTIDEAAADLRTLGFPELADEIMAIEQGEAFREKAKQEAFAGAENPLGIPFEGIIRWAKPVVDADGEIIGYVTFALNQVHIAAMIDHVTPMPERFAELSDAYDGNYAFIWDYKCRSIVHPRHHSIVGYNPETGKPETPWLESGLYEGMLAAGYEREDWHEYIASIDDYYVPWASAPDWVVELEPIRRAEHPLGDLVWTPEEVARMPIDFQSRSKRPALPLTQQGLVGLDGRYLNQAPQCTGWMDLTKDGGSGSFYILWSGLYKLTTAATIPYYTGQYSPDVQGNRRGFGFVAVGAGVDDFSLPAERIGDTLEEMVNDNISRVTQELIWTTIILSVLVIIIAIWMASYLSKKLQWLIDGITHFRRGHRHFRFAAEVKDEFGHLAHSFNEMAENVAHSVHSPLVITDLDLNIIYANDQALHVIGGKTLDDLVGKSYKEKSIYNYGSKNCPITALHEGRQAMVCYLRPYDRYLLGVANYLVDERGIKRGYIITSNDVTELSLKQIELELANQHKNRFLARMSHELRTPMNAIVGFNEISRTKATEIQSAEDIQELNDYLTQLKSASFDLLNLLNEILEVSNLESGETALTEKPMSLKDMLDGIVEKAARDCKEKHLELTVHIDKFSSAHFTTDGLRLQQVLVNLLDNAVKYTPKRGSVEFTVRQKERKEGKALISFSVRDTGYGISYDEIDSVFIPFEQMRTEEPKYMDGAGLGLAVVRNILNLFGTNITVHSKVGWGSTFAFELWLTETEEVRPVASSVDSGIRKRFVGKRALVIDDVRINRTVLVNLLKETGVVSDEAADGKEGLEMFERSPEDTYGVIFMDIQMPIMDGWESAVAIRALPRRDAKTVPIVTISANAFQEDIEKSLASGMNAHYAKPVKKEVLADILEMFCKPVAAYNTDFHG